MVWRRRRFGGVTRFPTFTPRSLRHFFGFAERCVAFFGLTAQRLELMLRSFAQGAIRDHQVSLFGLAIVAFFAAALEAGERILIREIARLEAVAIDVRKAHISADARAHASARAHGATGQQKSDGKEGRKSAHLPAVPARFFALA
jgi:hypothetical protein